LPGSSRGNPGADGEPREKSVKKAREGGKKEEKRNPDWVGNMSHECATWKNLEKPRKGAGKTGEDY